MSSLGSGVRGRGHAESFQAATNKPPYSSWWWLQQIDWTWAVPKQDGLGEEPQELLLGLTVCTH